MRESHFVYVESVNSNAFQILTFRTEGEASLFVHNIRKNHSHMLSAKQLDSIIIAEEEERHPKIELDWTDMQ